MLDEAALESERLSRGELDGSRAGKRQAPVQMLDAADARYFAASAHTIMKKFRPSLSPSPL